MAVTSYRARWVAPVDGEPIADAQLDIADGLLRSVGAARTGTHGPVDLGDVLIVPGFVNAHTHLELSACREKVPFEGSFIGWLETLVRTSRFETEPDHRIASAVRELDAALRVGVTAVADIATDPCMLELWRKAPAAMVGLLEVIGMGPRRIERHAQSWDVLAPRAEAEPVTDGVRVGLSPHAPYSVAPEIYRAAVAFARRTGRPLCTHLAETREELEFLAEGTGPFRVMLEQWGLWDGSFEVPRCSPVAYADRLGLLAVRPLLAHVNYVSTDDLDLLAERGASVIYCPRAHAFFGHPPHSFEAMLARGIPVCIGTDSLACNTSLSVLDELRFLHRRDDRVRPATLLAMGTLNGARALGLSDRCGSLEAGKRADWVAIPLSNPGTNDPIRDVLESEAAPSAVFLAGSPVSIDA